MEKGELRYEDLTGKRFGKLLAIERIPLEKRYAHKGKYGWLCRCDCGNMKVIPAGYLKSGDTKSCGCDSIQKAKERISIDGDNCYGRLEGTMAAVIKPERKLNSNNTSGVKGVHWSEHTQRWIAKIGFQGKQICIGSFQSIEDAKKARQEAEGKYFAPIIERWEKGQDKGKGEDIAC